MDLMTNLGLLAKIQIPIESETRNQMIETKLPLNWKVSMNIKSSSLRFSPIVLIQVSDALLGVFSQTAIMRSRTDM